MSTEGVLYLLIVYTCMVTMLLLYPNSVTSVFFARFNFYKKKQKWHRKIKFKNENEIQILNNTFWKRIWNKNDMINGKMKMKKNLWTKIAMVNSCMWTLSRASSVWHSMNLFLYPLQSYWLVPPIDASIVSTQWFVV